MANPLKPIKWRTIIKSPSVDSSIRYHSNYRGRYFCVGFNKGIGWWWGEGNPEKIGKRGLAGGYSDSKEGAMLGAQKYVLGINN